MTRLHQSALNRVTLAWTQCAAPYNAARTEEPLKSMHMYYRHMSLHNKLSRSQTNALTDNVIVNDMLCCIGKPKHSQAWDVERDLLCVLIRIIWKNKEKGVVY